jgi:diguanylate cyclase (GGDEF)-like protein
MDSELLELFSQEVLNYMIQNDIPSSPHNFEFYFNELLLKKNQDERKELEKFIDNNTTQDVNQDNIIELNHAIKDGFINIRKLHQLTSNIYNNSGKVALLIRKYPLDTKHPLNNTFKKFSDLLKKQTIEIKKIEYNTKLLLESLQKNNIYDMNFKVYNKNHILKLIDKEIEYMEKHSYQSSLLFLKIDNIDNIQDKKEVFTMNKFLSSILIKNARNSDFIGYLGDNLFIMLLTQTSLKNAKLAVERIQSLFNSAFLFLDGKEVSLDVKIKSRFLSPNSDIEEILLSIDDELAMI